MTRSQSIRFWKFSLTFVIYCLASIILYGTAAFTINAWIVYAFTVTAVYFLGLIYLIILMIQRVQFIRYRKSIAYLMLTFKLLTILSSPASCQGSKQGEACYSFIQSTLTDVSTQPTHWIVDHVFPWAVLVYVIATFTLLYTLRFETSASHQI